MAAYKIDKDGKKILTHQVKIFNNGNHYNKEDVEKDKSGDLVFKTDVKAPENEVA